jgi:Protein kinase domain
MSIATLFGIIAAVLVGAVLLAAVIFLFGKIFRLTFLVLRNIFRFIGEEVTDVLRFIGAVLASVLFAPLVVLSIVIGRWSASKHYAGSLMSELRAACRCVYRFVIGNPIRLLGLSYVLEGVEQRVPDAMAAAPTRDKPTKRVGMFDGYTIIGSLKGGGSGGKLYIAEPDEIKQAVFAKRKLGEVDQVVIKVFSLKDGSSLPQIVRESRALDSARSLGLVLEHQMAPERFYYVMRYVPGESLSAVTQRMHAMCSIEGLDNESLHSMMGYGEDLLVSLDTYHNAELWHKDVKPDNIIVDSKDKDAKAHLVDFGLVTPMRSAMTLTTHGTEYFRDPELVRQALRGVKVHQIDGSKFDVYAAGAVLFSMVENSFPAHGGLSQITKRCPDSLRWIVRRAMAEYDRRYPSAAAMLADLRVVLEAQDPYTIKPIDLPSVSDGDVAAADRIHTEQFKPFGGSLEPVSFAQAGSPAPRPVGPATPEYAASSKPRVGRPNVEVTSWWSGKYNIVGSKVQAQPQKDRSRKNKKKGFVVEAGIGEQGPYAQVNREPVQDARRLRDPSDRQPAAQQVREARKRAQQRRSNASNRINAKRGGKVSKRDYSNTPGLAVVFAGLLGMVVLLVGSVLGVAMFTEVFHNNDNYSAASPDAPRAPDAPRTESIVTISNGEVHFNDRSLFAQGGHEGQRATSFQYSKYPSDHDHDHAHNYAYPEVDAEVLLVSNLTRPIEDNVLHELQHSIEDLRSHGLEIRGDLTSTEFDEEIIVQTAELQNAIGSIPLDAPQLPSKVQEWLGSQPIDGVLMLATKPGEPNKRIAILVMDKFYTVLPLADDTVHDLLTLLSGNGYDN